MGLWGRWGGSKNSSPLVKPRKNNSLVGIRQNIAEISWTAGVLKKFVQNVYDGQAMKGNKLEQIVSRETLSLCYCCVGVTSIIFTTDVRSFNNNSVRRTCSL